MCEKEKKKLTARMKKLAEKRIKLAEIKEQSQANQRQIICKRDVIEKALRMSTENKLKFKKKHEECIDTRLKKLIEQCRCR